MFIFNAGNSKDEARIPLEISPLSSPLVNYDNMSPQKRSELILENQLAVCSRALTDYMLGINEAAFSRSKGKIKHIVKDIKHDYYIWQEPSERLLEVDRAQFITKRKELVRPLLSRLENVVKEYNLNKQMGAVKSYISSLESIR